jgi:hypothetical protein
MPHYPLFFTAREKVSGTRFLVEVTRNAQWQALGFP